MATVTSVPVLLFKLRCMFFFTVKEDTSCLVRLSFFLNGKFCYLVSDNLSSLRIVEQAAGYLRWEVDYHPRNLWVRSSNLTGGTTG